MSTPLFQANHHNGRLFLWRPSKTIDSKEPQFDPQPILSQTFWPTSSGKIFTNQDATLSFSSFIHLLEHVLMPFWRVVRRGIVCHSSHIHLPQLHSSMSCKPISLHHSMSAAAFWQCISGKAFYWNGSTSRNTDLELLLKIGNSLAPTVIHLLVPKASL